MFDEAALLQAELFQVMDDEGRVIRPDMMPEMPDERVVEAFKLMLFARQADLMAVSYQRQGRMYTYPPNLGQEATPLAAGLQMKQEDWLVPAFRELGAWLQKGATLKDIFLYWSGHEDGSRFPGASHMLPSTVPIASQLPHAVGIGYALKYQKREGMVFVFFGDGATSEGDFHESLNFAGVWKVPVLFICQNNQYAISVPLSIQTASRSLAVKALAYGISGVRVDGNDFFALSRVFSEAAARIRSGQGPLLVEAVTFRRGAHTTSDDPTLYRSREEEALWEKRDPVRRLRLYLQRKKLWDETEEEVLIAGYKKEIDAQFVAAENWPSYPLADVFRFTYRQMPEQLKKQQAAYEKFRNWQEKPQ